MANRANRRAQVRFHRKRAKAIARSQGCICPCELKLDPLDGRPVWCERSDSSRRVYLTKHRPDCPLHARYDPNEWVVVIPPEPECER